MQNNDSEMTYICPRIARTNLFAKIIPTCENIVQTMYFLAKIKVGERDPVSNNTKGVKTAKKKFYHPAPKKMCANRSQDTRENALENVFSPFRPKTGRGEGGWT